MATTTQLFAGGRADRAPVITRANAVRGARNVLLRGACGGDEPIERRRARPGHDAVAAGERVAVRAVVSDFTGAIVGLRTVSEG